MSSSSNSSLLVSAESHLLQDIRAITDMAALNNPDRIQSVALRMLEVVGVPSPTEGEDGVADDAATMQAVSSVACQKRDAGVALGIALCRRLEGAYRQGSVTPSSVHQADLLGNRLPTPQFLRFLMRLTTAHGPAAPGRSVTGCKRKRAVAAAVDDTRSAQKKMLEARLLVALSGGVAAWPQHLVSGLVRAAAFTNMPVQDRSRGMPALAAVLSGHAGALSVEEEVISTTDKVSLTRIRFPVRGPQCTHLQCCDLDALLVVCRTALQAEESDVDRQHEMSGQAAPAAVVSAAVNAAVVEDDDDDDIYGGFGESSGGTGERQRPSGMVAQGTSGGGGMAVLQRGTSTPMPRVKCPLCGKKFQINQVVLCPLMQSILSGRPPPPPFSIAGGTTLAQLKDAVSLGVGRGGAIRIVPEQ